MRATPPVAREPDTRRACPSLQVSIRLSYRRKVLDKAKSPLPSNLPIAADAAYLPTLGITQLQLVGPPIRSAFAVTFRRRSLAQRFVRTNSIVAIDPAIGSPLLSSHRAGGRSRQAGFEFPMHLFVRTILFGMTRRKDKLHLDAQRRPDYEALKCVDSSATWRVVHSIPLKHLASCQIEGSR